MRRQTEKTIPAYRRTISENASWSPFSENRRNSTRSVSAHGIRPSTRQDGMIPRGFHPAKKKRSYHGGTETRRRAQRSNEARRVVLWVAGCLFSAGDPDVYFHAGDEPKARIRIDGSSRARHELELALSTLTTRNSRMSPDRRMRLRVSVP